MSKRLKPSAESPTLFPESGTTWETRGVFSDHFIRRRLFEVESWPKDDAAAKALYDQILDLWARRHVGFEKGNEETTRREFLEKVLEKLGFAFFSNLDLPEWQRRQTPDYLLFQDERTKELVFNADLQAKYPAAVALLEAKKVNHPLDAVSKSEVRFPHQQVRDYLLAATDEPGQPYFRWGVLTNGNLWRLYYREARPDAYFQFHLAGPGAHFCSFEEFKTFLALFSPGVFVQTDGVCLLDRVRADAVQFQSELEESIRRRVFAVVEDLANGFWSVPENKLTDVDLRELYDNCLILLYRLLFVLYAEGRGLLPVKLSGAGSNTNYRARYSLKRLVPRLQNPAEYSSDDFAELNEEIGKLFRLINGDRPATNKACSVPPYNGGLFDSEAHPRLKEWRIGDKSLAGVLRDLIFSSGPGRRSGQREFEWGAIDYADLEVRQLGDIYEGLLGGHLEVVQEAGQSRLRVMGERGALQETGTFYTPDWVVRFLVDKTLEPLIDQIEGHELVAKAKQAGRKDNAFAREVLKLNIVDPAMGSGHFLVRATEWLADHIVYHQTTEFQVNEVSPGLSQEQAEVSYWRRRVVEACIYGVDMNPLAVELAKLSLWLTCIASEEPLNFLDHHLRPGNSLMGARTSELSSLPPERLTDIEEEQQIALSLGPDFADAVGDAIREIQAIESERSDSLEIVKDKERRWNERVRLKLKPFRDVADLWVASAAGLPVTQFQYCQLGELMLSKEAARARRELRNALEPLGSELKRVLKEVKPLHWELEFPDVFHEESGAILSNPGFDAILGNPPYISTQTSSEFTYREALEPRFGFADDLYVHFVFQGFGLLRKGGRFGFIISDTFFTLQTKLRLRELLQAHQLDYLVQCDPFRATVDAAMFVAQKQAEGEDIPTIPDLTFIQARNPIESSRPEDELPGLLKPNAEPELLRGQGAFKCGRQEFAVSRAQKGSLRIHRLSVGPYRQALKRCFFEPTEAVVRLYNRLNDPTRRLVNEWWQRIDTSRRFAENEAQIAAYRDKLEPGDTTLLGLIAEVGQGMVTANNGRFLGYLDQTAQAEAIRKRRVALVRDWQKDPRVGPVFRDLLASQHNEFELTVEPLKQRFHWKSVLGLQKGEIYRVVPQERVAQEGDFARAFEFRKAELEELWAKSPAVRDYYERSGQNADFFELSRALVAGVRQKSLSLADLGLRTGELYVDATNAPRLAAIYSGFVGARSWAPYRKGDSEGSRWSSVDPLFINWSRPNVSWLWDHSGRPEPSMPVLRNAHVFFTNGITWTRHGNHVGLKARLQAPCVFDTNGSRLTPTGGALATNQLLTILNADLLSYIIKKFVKNTQDYEINDLRMAPVVIPTQYQAKELESLANLAIEAKELSLKQAEPSVPLVRECQRLSEKQKAAPAYLRPDAQMLLFHTADDCLAVIELAVNWAVERLYQVEGLGPFNEF